MSLQEREKEENKKRGIFLNCIFWGGAPGGLMVSALDFGSSVPRLSPGRGHCVVDIVVASCY